MSAVATPVYKELSRLIFARQNCIKSGNAEWFDKHSEAIDFLVKNYLPSGSGVDRGTRLDLDASNPEKLVFHFGYHHMNEYGCYNGWTEHSLIVKPCLMLDIDLKITGRNKNDIKDYLYEIYHLALVQKTVQDFDGTRRLAGEKNVG